MTATKKIEGDETVHYLPPRKKRGVAKAKCEPPLTPMIDVTFQLLLFFLLTTQFRMEEGQIPGTLPSGDVGKSAEKVALEPIRVILIPTGEKRDGVQYEIQGLSSAIAGPEELYKELIGRAQPEGAESPPVYIRPRSDVRWGYVTEAFNQAVRAKFKTIGFEAEG